MFGVEATIQSQNLSWNRIADARDEFFVGDLLQLKVVEVEGDAPENLQIKVDVRSLKEDKSREKLVALKPQTNCIGTVTERL